MKRSACKCSKKQFQQLDFDQLEFFLLFIYCIKCQMKIIRNIELELSKRTNEHLHHLGFDLIDFFIVKN